MNSTCYIDGPVKVTPEGIARELRIIKSIRSDGHAHTARAREESLYEHVAEAIALGIITGEAAGMSAPDAADNAAPRFRLLP